MQAYGLSPTPDQGRSLRQVAPCCIKKKLCQKILLARAKVYAALPTRSMCPQNIAQQVQSVILPALGRP